MIAPRDGRFEGTTRRLLFAVEVEAEYGSKGLTEKDWLRIAQCLERAAQGRSKTRAVWVGGQTRHLS